MPKVTLNRADILYEEHGTAIEMIVFAHGLLWGGRMFDNQVEALKNRYRCITFDFQGHVPIHQLHLIRPCGHLVDIEGSLATDSKGGAMRVRSHPRLSSCFLVILIGALSACGLGAPPDLEALAQTGVVETAAAFTETSTQPPGPSRTHTRAPSATFTQPAPPTFDWIEATREFSKTQTAISGICIRWDEVKDRHIGHRICVYGVIVKLQETSNYAQIVRFSEEAGTFLIKSRWFTYVGINRGDCVKAEGTIIRDGNYLSMEIREASMYQYDGCEAGP
jgi:hypothetical protein